MLRLKTSCRTKCQMAERAEGGLEFNSAERLKVALSAYSALLQFIIASLIIYFSA